VAAAVKRGDLGQAAAEVPWEEVGEPRLKAAYGEALQAAVKKAGIVTAEPVGAHFDVLDRRPLEWMEERSASFIREFGSMTQQGMRDTLAEMVRSGMSVEKTAKLFRDQIGLTPNLSKAVANYRAELEAKGMAAERIERLVERKTRQLLAYRGRLIARTEAQDAATFGQNEAWKQAAEEGLIDIGTFEREWVTTSNPCPEVCDGMNGQRVKLGEKFLTDDGRYIDGPGGEAHPNCLCTLTGVHSEAVQAA
jgi:hypothetical protein